MRSNNLSKTSTSVAYKKRVWVDQENLEEAQETFRFHWKMIEKLRVTFLLVGWSKMFCHQGNFKYNFRSCKFSVTREFTKRI